jgi:TetR/AcrR family transcriptional regulator, regulator of cefoperazone and chloramphenicol sensitivity
MESINIGSVPRDATDTRERLIRAGEHLFARQGVDGARTADIRKAAGQLNESALQYHFGGRQGLLVAIFRKHLAATEPARRGALTRLDAGPASGTSAGNDADHDDARRVVEALVLPDAERLHSPDGRDYLRIIVQVAGRAGVQRGPARLPVEGSALADVLDRLGAWLAARLPEPVARERAAAAIGFLTIALADRARRIDEGDAVLVRHDTFTRELVAMITGALTAAHDEGDRDNDDR